MQTRQGNTVKSLRAVDAFIDDNVDKLPDIATSGARKDLVASIADLSAHAIDQGESAISAQSASRRTRALRARLLRNYMAPISRIARAALPDTEELLPLRTPRGNPITEKVAVAARSMAQAAARNPGVFIAAGLPVDFLSRLEAATVAMLQSVDEGSKNRGRMRGATEGLSTRLRQARLAVSILDALVRVALADDPALLTNWNRIKSVQRSRVRTALADTPSAPAPVAAAA